MSHTAFVTGATGFVGVNLVRALLRKNWQVHALLRPSSSMVDLQDLAIEIHRGDITDLTSLQSAMGRPIDCVFHVAANTNVWSKNNHQQTAINVQGTQNVIQAAKESGIERLIHTSSFVVYGFQPQRFNEDTPRLNNASWINYVRTKISAEQLVQEAVLNGSLDAVIVNPGHILGPYDRHNWSRMIGMVHHSSLPGVPPGGGSFADVRQVAEAQIEAYHRGRRGNNYLLGGNSAEYLDIIGMVGEILNRPVPQKPMPAVLLRALARVKTLAAGITGKEPDLTPESAAMITHHMHCDSGKASKELGYQPTPVRQLLEDTCDWMYSAGLLKS